MSALPPPGFTTFGTGQPIFMSIISGLKPFTILTACAINCGSSPKSCSAYGLSSSVTEHSSLVFAEE